MRKERNNYKDIFFSFFWCPCTKKKKKKKTDGESEKETSRTAIRRKIVIMA
jgi:hypothetical protein